MDTIRYFQELVLEEKYKNSKFVIFSHKQDLEDSLKEDDLVSFFELYSLPVQWKVYLTSVNDTNKKNMDLFFDWI